MRNLFLASATVAAVAAGFATGLGAGGHASAQTGSFSQSCRNVRSSNGMLTADCADSGGRFRTSTLPFAKCHGDIGNNNGMLVCNGATATGGQVAGGGNNNDNQRRDDGRNNGGGFAGGPPAGPPPSFGDPRYGDPRYDPRYAQGGWGYGRRPGEWVPIRDRANWLEMRIDRAQRDGSIGRNDARDLRRQLNFIEDQEARYMSDGRFGPRERADLDRRFDDLSARIRYQTRP
jgi:hypothetical protein